MNPALAHSKLSYGSLERLAVPGTVEKNGLVLQALMIKEMPSKNGLLEEKRFRAYFSDGKNLAIELVLFQAADAKLIETGQLKEFSVVKFGFVQSQLLKDKLILLCQQPSVLETPGFKYGEPSTAPLKPAVATENQGAIFQGAAPQFQASSDHAYAPYPTSGPGNVAGFAPQPAQNPNLTHNAPYMPAAPAQSGFPGVFNPSGGHVDSLVKIQALNPFQNKWTVEAAVTFKSEVKTYKNAKGEGKLFNVQFLDDSGEIRATAFNEQVDKFYDMLEVGKTYRISQLKVNTANKRFSTLDHDYELMFGQLSEVEPSVTTGPTPSIYNFSSIKDVENASPHTAIDLLGVVKEVSDVSRIMSQKLNKELVKRDVVLVDPSMKSIRLTLWDKMAEEFTAEVGAVLACRSLRVSDFSGKTLNTSNSTALAVNPNLPEAYNMLTWWRSQDGSSQFGSLSGAGKASQDAVANLPTTPLRDIKDHPTFGKGGPEVFNTTAMLCFIRDNPTYPACPQQDCNKKVTPSGNQWYCAKCDASFPAPEYRYILTGCISDDCSSIWIQLFNDQAITVLGGTADNYEEIKVDPNQLNLVHANACFKPYKFTISAKNELYNDVHKMRYTVRALKPVDPVERIQELCSWIDRL
ncbi:Replication factor A protein 1, partial [Massospora cicadina]